MISNAVILLIGYIIDISMVIYWVTSSNCETTEWPFRRIKKVVVRTAVIYLVLGLICWLFQFDVLDTILLLLCIILGFLIMVVVGLELFCYDPILLPIFDVLFKWIFDVPSVELLFPSNKKYEYPDDSLKHLIGKNGCVESTLRPIGEVSIDGQKHIATSETDFIEKGTTVTVIAIKNSNLVVRIVNE